jgi:hypothetical protein
MKRAGVVLALVAVIVLAFVSTATAAWQAGSAVNSKGSAKTMTVPQGATPTASVAGDAVTVTWTATTSPPATGYTVKVYDASSHIARPIGAGCSGIVTASPCTETGVPGGTWEYSATPLVDAWVGGESARSGPVTVDAAPQPTALALVNGGGGTAGVIDPERDEVKITYSEPLAVDTICAGWTDNTANQSLSADGDVEVTVTDNAGANTLAVTSTACPSLSFGAIALGGDYITGSTATFSGSTTQSSSVSWNVATRTLTIHLGALTTGTLSGSPVTAATVLYTPVGSLQDVAGHAMAVAAFNSATPQRF